MKSSLEGLNIKIKGFKKKQNSWFLILLLYQNMFRVGYFLSNKRLNFWVFTLSPAIRVETKNTTTKVLRRLHYHSSVPLNLVCRYHHCHSAITVTLCLQAFSFCSKHADRCVSRFGPSGKASSRGHQFDSLLRFSLKVVAFSFFFLFFFSTFAHRTPPPPPPPPSTTEINMNASRVIAAHVNAESLWLWLCSVRHSSACPHLLSGSRSPPVSVPQPDDSPLVKAHWNFVMRNWVAGQTWWRLNWLSNTQQTLRPTAEKVWMTPQRPWSQSDTRSNTEVHSRQNACSWGTLIWPAYFIRDELIRIHSNWVLQSVLFSGRVNSK